MALAGCGDESRRAAPTTPVAETIPRDLQPPRGVPRRGDGRPADPAQARVIRRWAATLRRGDERRAAHFFALPSRFQNVTGVLTIDSELERQAIQESLVCGATPVAMERAGRYTAVTFRLSERPGRRCGSTGVVRCIIRVRGGRIVEFYRLLDSADQVPQPQIDPGPYDA